MKKSSTISKEDTSTNIPYSQHVALRHIHSYNVIESSQTVSSASPPDSSLIPLVANLSAANLSSNALAPLSL